MTNRHDASVTTDDLRPPKSDWAHLSVKQRLQEIERRHKSIFHAHPRGPEAVIETYHDATEHYLRDVGFMLGELKRAWVALDLLQGTAAPYEVQRVPGLSKSQPRQPPPVPRADNPSHPVIASAPVQLEMRRPAGLIPPTGLSDPPPRRPPTRVTKAQMEAAIRKGVETTFREITGHETLPEEDFSDVFGNPGPDPDGRDPSDS